MDEDRDGQADTRATLASITRRRQLSFCHGFWGLWREGEREGGKKTREEGTGVE